MYYITGESSNTNFGATKVKTAGKLKSERRRSRSCQSLSFWRAHSKLGGMFIINLHITKIPHKHLASLAEMNKKAQYCIHSISPHTPVNMHPPLYNHMEKTDFLYYEFEVPNGTSQLNSVLANSVKFSAKIRKKKIRCAFLVITLLMLQN